MPFYEYECSSCKFYKEVMQKVSDAPLKKCPSCGRNTLKKLISVPVFRLKGAGWYETDFKTDRESKRNLAVGDEKEASKTEAKTESTTETKAAAKPEDKSQRTDPKPSKKPVRKPAAKKSARKSAA